MKKWWRRFKNKRGWDFVKKHIGLFYYRCTPSKKYSDGHGDCFSLREAYMVSDPYGCYIYECKYCGKIIRFPWRDTNLAYHNMQRHIKAKHIDVL